MKNKINALLAWAVIHTVMCANLVTHLLNNRQPAGCTQKHTQMLVVLHIAGVPFFVGTFIRKMTELIGTPYRFVQFEGIIEASTNP